MISKVVFITAIFSTIILSIGLEYADASFLSKMKKDLKKMEKTNEDVEDMNDCAIENLEKTNYYADKGKIYIANPDCDEDEQYKYDKLNKQNGIYENKDSEKFIVDDD